MKKSAQRIFVLFFSEKPAAKPVKTITCSTCVAKDPLSFVSFASDETLERHQVKVHGAEPSEKLKKMLEEEKKAEEDELDVMDMADGGMDFGSDSEEEVVALPPPNKPSVGASKMASIKANMAKGNQIRVWEFMCTPSITRIIFTLYVILETKLVRALPVPCGKSNQKQNIQIIRTK